MSSSESLQLYEIAARKVLDAFGLHDQVLAFLRHGDSVTFKAIGRKHGAYLLRLHSPIVSNMRPNGVSADELISELVWIEALSRETDLALQSPVRTPAGELITAVEVEGHREPVFASLLEWIDGVPYHRDLETAQTAHQIGATFATLHQHASTWREPPGFLRPKRDSDYFLSSLGVFKQSVSDGVVDGSAYDELAQVVHWLVENVSLESRESDSFGILHADGHKGNMLLHAEGIRLIDFSFCAFGNYMFDLGVVLSDMKPDLIPECIAGYEHVRPLPDGYERLVEGLFLGSIVSTFTFWAQRPESSELLKSKVPQVVRDFAIPFNRGGGFWFA